MMKSKSILWMLFIALFACGQTAWAQWTGSGSQGNPYQISSTDDWDALATAVNSGKPYIVKLPTDIQYRQYSRDRYYDANAFDGDPLYFCFYLHG